jgi:methionyl-tRNA formyltransferase
VRIVYLGTPEIAIPPLRALHAAGHDIALVVSRKDARRGRGSSTSASPVKAVAHELSLPVSENVDDVLTVGAELGVVVAYGRIIKPHVLQALPMVNLHFSLLPRWRGAAPMERALLEGDTETGVCLMDVEDGLDTGAVYRRVTVPITEHSTGTSLHAALVEAGTTMLVDALAEGLGTPEPQDGEPTYAAKIGPADLHIDWEGDPVRELRKVRLGGAWTTVAGRRLKVLDAAVSDGALVPTVVQPEGKGAMAYSAWRNGARTAVLGS